LLSFSFSHFFSASFATTTTTEPSERHNTTVFFSLRHATTSLFAGFRPPRATRTSHLVPSVWVQNQKSSTVAVLLGPAAPGLDAVLEDRVELRESPRDERRPQPVAPRREGRRQGRVEGGVDVGARGDAVSDERRRADPVFKRLYWWEKRIQLRKRGFQHQLHHENTGNEKRRRRRKRKKLTRRRPCRPASGSCRF